MSSQERSKDHRKQIRLILPFLGWLFLSGLPVTGYPQQAGTKVSLVTVGPGTELYSAFGHSVLWFSNPETGLDLAFNYGTFSFQTDNFYVKFLRGTLPYKLDAGQLAPQVHHWMAENRTVSEQVLNLSPDRKERLLALLSENYRPENREYKYLFFYDNCATRLQDVLVEAVGDSLRYEGYTQDSLSFRQWIDRYAYRQNPWADFGMDLAIGTPADEIATPMQATFLPDNLSKAYEGATTYRDGEWVPLVAATNTLFTAAPAPARGWLTPTVLFWLLAGLTLVLTWWQRKRQKIDYTFDRLLFGICGLAGCFLLILWFATDHGVTAGNWDVLWACPLLIPMSFYLSPKKKIAWLQLALIGYGVLLLAATINLEKHNLVLLPILLILIIRVYYINNSQSQLPTI